IASRRMLDAKTNAECQVAAVSVMPNLMTRTEDVQRVLPFEHLLNEIWYNVGHCELYIAAGNLTVSQGTLFPYSHRVERTSDCIGQLILFPGALSEIFRCEFLEAIRRARRRASVLRSFRSGKFGSALEDHTGRENRYFLQAVLAMGVNGRIK